MSEIRIKTLVVGMVGTNCYLVYDHETKRAAVIDRAMAPVRSPIWRYPWG